MLEQSLVIVVSLFLGVMGLCWIPPVIQHVAKSSPPAFMRCVYSVMTVLGLFLGVRLLTHRALRESFSQYLYQCFLDGMVPGRLTMVLFVTSLAMAFVIGNVARSYFNLHRVEEDDDPFPLRTIIARLRNGMKVLEFLLRVSMFVLILGLTNTIRLIRDQIPDSGATFNVFAFREQFYSFWHFSLAYYVVLLAWDTVIWLHRNRAEDKASAQSARGILMWQAIPVHGLGLFVSTLMSLPGHGRTLALNLDLFYAFAGGMALLGWGFLIASAVSERHSIRRACVTLASVVRASRVTTGLPDARSTAAVVLLSVALLSGCGSQPAQRNSIRVGLLQHGSSIPVLVAQKNGYFSQRRVLVEFVDVTPGQHMPSLLNGEVDVITPSSFPVIFSTYQQNRGKIQCYLVGGESKSGDTLYGIVVRKDSPYRGLADLVGRTIGSASPFTTVNLRNVLSSKFHDNAGKTVIRDVGDRSMLIQGLASGTLDGAVVDQPALSSAALQQGYRIIERNFRAEYLFEPYWSGAGVVRTAWRAAHSSQYESFLDAIDDALQFCAKKPSDAKAIFIEHFGLGDVRGDSIGMYVYPGARHRPPEGFTRALMEMLVENKLLADRFDATQLFYSR